jgi:hypothetical protein
MLMAPAARAVAAEAPSPIRVLLVIDQSDDPFAERIRAELVSLGLEVVTAEPWRTGEPVESLDGAARAAGAAAAVRMVHSRRGVEIWTADQPTGRSLLRQLIVDESPRDPNQGLIALQTAELLRTSLLANNAPRSAGPSKLAARPDGPPAAGPPAIAATPSRAEPATAGVQAALGAMYSAGAGDAAMQAWLSLHRLIFGRVGLAIDVTLPIHTSTVSGPEGSARLGVLMGGVAAVTSMENLPVGLYATVGAGVGVARITADGDAIQPLISHDKTAVTPVLYGRGDAGIEATRWLRFGLRAVAGLATSNVTLRFAGNDAGTWGRPFLAAFLMTELTWR